LTIRSHGFQVIQRISVQSTDATGVDVTLSFDDTPGLGDTKHFDRDWIEALIRKYDTEYYPDVPLAETARVPQPPAGGFRRKVYPNAILLVTSWQSIKNGDDPSPIRQTMGYLADTKLIDYQYQNVVVVVTKSLKTFVSDYEDFHSDNEKNEQWRLDADEKTRIIDDLRSIMFPSSKAWPVVFIENGGGAILQEYIRLPNGDLSHQNLFQAIFRSFYCS
jgi:hypothetical protein